MIESKKTKLSFLLFATFAVVLILSGCVKPTQTPSSVSSLSLVNKWKLIAQDLQASGPVYSSPAVTTDGTVFVGGQNGLYRLSKDGSPDCFSSVKSVYSSPAFDSTSDTIFVGNSSGQLMYSTYPFSDCKTVQVSYFPILSTPIVLNGKIYVVDDMGNLYGVSETNMKVAKLGAIDGAAQIWTSPVTNGEDLFFGGDNRVFYAMNLTTGKGDWEHSLDGPVYGSAAIDGDGNVYVAAKTLYSFTPSGTLRWKNSLDGSQIYANPVISSDGTVYIGTIDGNFYAVNSQTGKTIWKVSLNSETNGVSSSALIGNNGVVYVASGYVFYALDASDGDTVDTVDLGYTVESNPVMYGGMVYVGCDDGYLYEISSTGTDLASGGWPMFMHNMYHSGR